MSVQTLYQQLRSAALQDPVMHALFKGEVSLDDIAHVDQALTAQYAAFQHPNRVSNWNQVCNPNRVKTLVARNLPRDVQIQELRQIFEAYGPVRDIYIPKNTDSSSPYYGTTKGFALIKFLDADSSTNAYQGEVSKLTLRNRLVAIEFAKADR